MDGRRDAERKTETEHESPICRSGRQQRNGNSKSKKKKGKKVPRRNSIDSVDDRRHSTVDRFLVTKPIKQQQQQQQQHQQQW